MTDQMDKGELVELVADIVSAYVTNNPVQAPNLPELIETVHASLSKLASGDTAAEIEKPVPAVPVKRSVRNDHIVCLECGKTFKSLKRHLSTHHELTPEQYRAKWSLLSDYPMVAPAYAAQRSAMALKIGLGRKSKAAAMGRRKK
ncbi:MAG: MucR family transcriptional regulator [Rhizobiaceae bacterium]